MRYTLEQLKNLTPIERNNFIDLLIAHFYGVSSLERIGICSQIKCHIIDLKNDKEDILLAMQLLKIPILFDNVHNSFWFLNHYRRVSFLKAIKTAE